MVFQFTFGNIVLRRIGAEFYDLERSGASPILLAGLVFTYGKKLWNHFWLRKRKRSFAQVDSLKRDFSFDWKKRSFF